MFDFADHLEDDSTEKLIDPIAIYGLLDRSSDTGPLRPAQEAVLTEWYEKRQDQQDVILKLHTGQGKTLVGLLMLQSRLNAGLGPALYLCPNQQLVEQTQEQAKKFGIPFVDLEADGSLPSDFLQGDAILIVVAQKLFTGRTKFGTGTQSLEVGAIVLDDSHACIDIIRDAFTIKLPRVHALWQQLFTLFEPELAKQGLGRVAEIRGGIATTFLPLPYWTWQEQLATVSDLLVKYGIDQEIRFAWPLLRDVLLDCQCYISGNAIQISPYHNPIDKFGSFSQASLRVFMSATTNDDSFFVKNLGLSADTVRHPLVYMKEKWSGEKMIITPYQLSERLDRQSMIDYFAATVRGRNYGVVAMVHSKYDGKRWEKAGALVLTPQNIRAELAALKEGDGERTRVIVNRYDGIDLPDASCRILVMDSKPYAQTLSDLYQEDCREGSDLINVKIAQKVEQGLGRAVRGERDYCIIVVIGADLVQYLRSKKFWKYFSPQTQRQIELGIQTTSLVARNDTSGNPQQQLSAVLSKSLTRDVGWKRFYDQNMNKITPRAAGASTTLAVLELERKAEENYRQKKTEQAVQALQTIINTHFAHDQAEQGWYYQEMARMYYSGAQVRSNELQAAAHAKNLSLLIPRQGTKYKKLISQAQVDGAKKWLQTIGSYDDSVIELTAIFSHLEFTTNNADKFEKALQETAAIIGFTSSRPDKEHNAGPDVLWSVSDTEYILYEAKNGVLELRDEIHKHETGQMANHLHWFERNYPNANGTPIMVIPTNQFTKAGGLREDVRIMSKPELAKLRQNVRNYLNEFRMDDFQNLTSEKVTAALAAHRLTKNDLKSHYSVRPVVTT